MKNKIYRIILLLVILSLGGVPPLSSKEFDSKIYYKGGVGTDGKMRNLYSVLELKKKNFTFGTYHVEGYVVKTYTCPPCPKGAMCKPCMPDNIVISDTRKKLKHYALTEKDLMLFVKDAKKFRVGRKYRILIHISDVRSANKDFNNTKVIYFERI